MNTTNEMPDGEIYVKLLGEQNFDSTEGDDLLAIIKENIKPRRKFLIDLSAVNEITPDGFHRLQQLIVEANKAFCEIIFTNPKDSIEELISSLTLNDES